MNTLLDRPILALAWLAAMVLLALGFRRVRASGRSGLFLTAMSLFMAFQGATVPDAAAKDPKKVTGKKTGLPVPSELRKGETWAQFKDLWQRLDAVVPRSASENPSLIPLDYSMAVEPEQQEAFRKELAGILGVDPGQLFRIRFTGPPQKKGIAAPDEHLSTLGRALAVLTMKRIDHMGMDPTMMMRMVPPPTLQHRGSVVERIERRIDSLVALRAKGVVSGGEFEAALGTLQDDVWLHSLLAVFDDHRLGYFGPIGDPGAQGQEWINADAWIEGFKAVCSQPDQEALTEACRQVRERLDMLKGIRKDLAALIAELETP